MDPIFTTDSPPPPPPRPAGVRSHTLPRPGGTVQCTRRPCGSPYAGDIPLQTRGYTETDAGGRGVCWGGSEEGRVVMVGGGWWLCGSEKGGWSGREGVWRGWWGRRKREHLIINHKRVFFYPDKKNKTINVLILHPKDALYLYFIYKSLPLPPLKKKKLGSILYRYGVMATEPQYPSGGGADPRKPRELLHSPAPAGGVWGGGGLLPPAR